MTKELNDFYVETEGNRRAFSLEDSGNINYNYCPFIELKIYSTPQTASEDDEAYSNGGELVATVRGNILLIAAMVKDNKDFIDLCGSVSGDLHGAAAALTSDCSPFGSPLGEDSGDIADTLLYLDNFMFEDKFKDDKELKRQLLLLLPTLVMYGSNVFIDGVVAFTTDKDELSVYKGADYEELGDTHYLFAWNM